MTRPRRIVPESLPVEPWLRQFAGVAGFLRAIAEEPWDDTHRLILADWLEEHGADERAEFLRLACQLADREAWEYPDGAAARLEQLHRQHAATWAVGLPAGVQFVRGLAVGARLTADPDTARLNALAAACDLQELIWAVAERVPIPFAAADWGRWLAWCPALRTVTGLDLNAALSGDQLLAELLRSPHLRRLERVRLASVNLHSTVLRALLVSPLLAGPDLLDLRGNPLAQQGAEAVAQWHGLASLSVLSLRDTRIGERGIQALTSSPQRPALKRLYLNQTEARIATGALLAAWPALATLTTLDLSVNLLRDEGVAALVASPHLARLEALNLRDNQITDAGARALVEAPALGNLRVLVLSHNRIGLRARRRLQERWPFVRF